MNKASIYATILVNLIIAIIFIYGLSALLSVSFWSGAGAVICIGFATNAVENVFESTVKLIQKYREKEHKDGK